MNIELAAAFSGAKGIYDLVRGIHSATTLAAVKEKTEDLLDLVSTLRSQLFEIQSEMADLYHAKAQIEEKLEKVTRWDHEIVPRYELKAIADGVLVYAQRQIGEGDGSATEPNHYLCPRCYEDRRKGFFQRTGYEPRGLTYTCGTCGLIICDHTDRPPVVSPIVSVPRRSRIDFGDY